MFNVLVLGHSFVKRADNFISLGNEGVTYNLGLSDATFCFMGVSGLQVAGLKDLKSTVSETSPDFIILDIGTNDIANGSDPIQLARQLYTIAQDYCFHLCAQYLYWIFSPGPVRHLIRQWWILRRKQTIIRPTSGTSAIPTIVISDLYLFAACAGISSRTSAPTVFICPLPPPTEHHIPGYLNIS